MAKMFQILKGMGITLPVASPPSAFPGKVLQAQLVQSIMFHPWPVGQVRVQPLPLAEVETGVLGDDGL